MSDVGIGTTLPHWFVLFSSVGSLAALVVVGVVGGNALLSRLFGE